MGSQIKPIDFERAQVAMVQAMRDRKDPHRASAAAIYGVSEDQVTEAQREHGKLVNWNLMYTPTCTVECRT